jgi:chromosome segregation ATPase
MSKTISVRVAPMTGRASSGQRDHDLRDPKKTPDYVDQSKSHLNSVILATPKPSTIRDEIAANRLAAGQKKLQANARITIAGIITFGTEAQSTIQNLSERAQNDLFEKVAARVARETKHPILGLVVHRDESAIHAHFTLRGYRLENGREQAPRLTPTDLKRLQDVVAEEVRHLGIERGTPKTERQARGDSLDKIIHRSVAELHADLPKEIAALAEKRDYYAVLLAKAETKLQTKTAKAEALEKRISVYEHRISDLDQTIEQKELRLQQIEASQEKRASDWLGTVNIPIEPMKTVRVEVIEERKLLTTITSEHDVISTKEAARYVKQVEEREQAMSRKLISVFDAGNEKERKLQDQLDAIRDLMKNDPEIAAIVARWKQEEALEATKTVAKSRDIDYGHER